MSVADEYAVYEYAKHLAISMNKQYFPENTTWEPLKNVMGLLSQIDNMVTGLVHKKYKGNLRAVLEGIGCKKIDWVMEQSPEYLNGLGKTTAAYAKVGAMVKMLGIDEVNKIRKEVLDGEKENPSDAES